MAGAEVALLDFEDMSVLLPIIMARIERIQCMGFVSIDGEGVRLNTSKDEEG